MEINLKNKGTEDALALFFKDKKWIPVRILLDIDEVEFKLLNFQKMNRWSVRRLIKQYLTLNDQSFNWVMAHQYYQKSMKTYFFQIISLTPTTEFLKTLQKIKIYTFLVLNIDLFANFKIEILKKNPNFSKYLENQEEWVFFIEKNSDQRWTLYALRFGILVMMRSGTFDNKEPMINQVSLEIELSCKYLQRLSYETCDSLVLLSSGFEDQLDMDALYRSLTKYATLLADDLLPHVDQKTSLFQRFHAYFKEIKLPFDHSTFKIDLFEKQKYFSNFLRYFLKIQNTFLLLFLIFFIKTEYRLVDLTRQLARQNVDVLSLKHASDNHRDIKDMILFHTIQKELNKKNEHQFFQFYHALSTCAGRRGIIQTFSLVHHVNQLSIKGIILIKKPKIQKSKNASSLKVYLNGFSKKFYHLTGQHIDFQVYPKKFEMPIGFQESKDKFWVYHYEIQLDSQNQQKISAKHDAVQF